MKEYDNYSRMIYAGSTVKIRAMGKNIGFAITGKKYILTNIKM